jgi:pimeloyl-ACP methyl ester carboxylesterase
VIGEEDRVIPAAVQRFEAERAAPRRTLEIPGASHAAAVSHPAAVAEQILEAARLPVAA